MHLTCSRDCSDKGWFDSVANSLHLSKGAFERQGHLLPRQIAGCEDKFAYSVLFESAPFEEAIADSLIGGEQGPTLLADEWQPGLVPGSTGEVIEVAFEAHCQTAQSLQNRCGVAEVFVEV